MSKESHLIDESQWESTSSKQEIRPGRWLMCRTISLANPSPLANEEGNDLKDNTRDMKSLHVLFVHGSCARSSQFDDLLEYLKLHFRSFYQRNCSYDTKKKNKPTMYNRIQFHLFDAYGCGESALQNGVHKWEDYSEWELAKDLEEVFNNLVVLSDEPGTKNKRVYIIAHSYGTSQVIKLINSDCHNHRVNDYSAVDGLVLIGGALKGSSNEAVANVTHDNGHWIFQFPVFVLNWLQPSLSHGFAKMAFHPNTLERQPERLHRSLSRSNANSMAICKAFYRQKKWAAVDDAQGVKARSLVIHGRDDMVVPIAGGRHLADSLRHSEFVAIPETSHQVFEEQPDVVGEHILKFIFNGL